MNPMYHAKKQSLNLLANVIANNLLLQQCEASLKRTKVLLQSGSVKDLPKSQEFVYNFGTPLNKWEFDLIVELVRMHLKPCMFGWGYAHGASDIYISVTHVWDD